MACVIFAVEAAAEGGNICADTIQAFLPLQTAEALLADGKSRAGMFQATFARGQHLSKQKIANTASIARVNQQRSVSHPG